MKVKFFLYLSLKIQKPNNPNKLFATSINPSLIPGFVGFAGATQSTGLINTHHI
jgi:hypothetical protein